MKSVFDVPADRLIANAAAKLKDVPEVKPPAWMPYAKSGTHRERAPEQPDFWYIRCASILRQAYINGPVGVSELRRHYGGAKGHTVKRAHKRRAGGNIIRKAFQQLEKAGLVEKKKEGRVISGKGKSFLDGISRGL